MNIHLSNFSNHLWDCIEYEEFRTDNSELFGRIFVHRAKDKYDYYNNNNMVEKIEEIFHLQITTIYPAKEPTILEILPFHPEGEKILSSFSQKISESSHEDDDKIKCHACIHSIMKMLIKIEYIQCLYFLGYKFKLDASGGYFTTPDHIFLQNRWKLLQKEKPYLPDFKIAPVKGLLDSKSYIEKHLKNTCILSYGTEYVHDHFYHIIPTILLMIKSGKNGNPYYNNIRSRFNYLIKINYQFIQDLKSRHDSEIKKDDLEKLEFIFSGFIDTTLSYRDYDHLEEILKNFDSEIIRIMNKKNPVYQRVIGEHFPEDTTWDAKGLVTRFRALFNQERTNFCFVS